MQQQEMFHKAGNTLAPNPPANWHETSQQAAEQIKPDAATLRQRVYEYIESRGARGATDQEVQEACGMAGNTERPRRSELVESGKVEQSGKTRKTRTQRLAIVWRTM